MADKDSRNNDSQNNTQTWKNYIKAQETIRRISKEKIK